jgi:hypothetical protein
MPFKKVGKNTYKSPSGKKFTEKQVKLYHALGDKFPEQKKTSRRKNVRTKKY